jgi:crotonobetainyl-CoA hydratase
VRLFTQEASREAIMAKYEFLSVERDGRLTIVTINRPEVYNALHSPAHAEFDAVFNDFAADPEQWVGIVTGAGDKAFSASNDLSNTRPRAGRASASPQASPASPTASISTSR